MVEIPPFTFKKTRGCQVSVNNKMSLHRLQPSWRPRRVRAWVDLQTAKRVDSVSLYGLNRMIWKEDFMFMKSYSGDMVNIEEYPMNDLLEFVLNSVMVSSLMIPISPLKMGPF